MMRWLVINLGHDGTMLEIFAGHAMFSSRARRRDGWGRLSRSRTSSTGSILLVRTHTALLKDLIVAQKPTVVSLAPPLWSMVFVAAHAEAEVGASGVCAASTCPSGTSHVGSGTFRTGMAAWWCWNNPRRPEALRLPLHAVAREGVLAGGPPVPNSG